MERECHGYSGRRDYGFKAPRWRFRCNGLVYDIKDREQMMLYVNRLLFIWLGCDCRAEGFIAVAVSGWYIVANVDLSAHQSKMTVENTTIKSRIKNLLRQPSIKLRRSKPGNNKENLSSKVQYAELMFSVRWMWICHVMCRCDILQVNAKRRWIDGNVSHSFFCEIWTCINCKLCLCNNNKAV